MFDIAAARIAIVLFERPEDLLDGNSVGEEAVDMYGN